MTIFKRIARLVPDHTNVDFMRVHLLGFLFSGLLVVGSIFMLATKGLHWGIDFTGGLIIEANITPAPDLTKLRGELNALDLGSVSLQEFGSPENLMIRLPQQQGGEDARKAAETKVRTQLASDPAFKVEYRRVEYVGPAVGDELRHAGIVAVLLAVTGIMGYIWMRFEWQFSLATVATLLHDAIIMLGFFSVTGLEFDLPAVAAVLTITGYSVNDTVVVFDYVRDALRKYRKMPMPELLNLAINRTLSRTQMTAFTTLLALISLYVFGGAVIHSLTWALIVGVVAGTYSSVFISSPLLLYMNPRKGKSRLIDQAAA